MYANIPKTREELSKLKLTELKNLIESIENEDDKVSILSDWKKFFYTGVEKNKDLTEDEKSSSKIIVQTLNSINKKQKFDKIFIDYSKKHKLDSVISKEALIKKYNEVKTKVDEEIKKNAQIEKYLEKIGSTSKVVFDEELQKEFDELSKLIQTVEKFEAKKSEKKDTTRKDALDRIKKLDDANTFWNAVLNVSDEELFKFIQKHSK